MNIKDRLRYFTAKYRIKEVSNKFGEITYIAQFREYYHWNDIKVDTWSTENNIKIEISEYLGSGNRCETYKYANSIIDHYDILINSLVEPKTIYKY